MYNQLNNTPLYSLPRGISFHELELDADEIDAGVDAVSACASEPVVREETLTTPVKGQLLILSYNT